MAFSRTLSVISLISVSWLAAVGCGDDDDGGQQPGASGEGGEAGSGGTSAGGEAGLGGTSAGGTNGGSAGDAGHGTGGSAGDAGHGSGGQPVIGGAGGEPSVGGAGGAGGEGPITVRAAQCGNSCEEDEDCRINEDQPYACDLETKRCYDPTVVCANDASCVPGASFWSTQCVSDDDCAEDDSERCVAFNGVGYCAMLPDQGACFFGEPADLPVFGGGTTATVCASFLSRCREGQCMYNCADPIYGGLCGVGNGDSCNEVTGLCECSAGTECEGSGVCQTNKLCAECVTDQDCIAKDAAGLDKCFEGKCGCGTASSCPDTTQAAMPVCE